MRKNKVMFFMLLFVLLFFSSLFKIKALEIENAGVGNKGTASGSCNTGFCGNTIGLKISGKSFNNTAIYGMRVTIVDAKGKIIRSPINFWATDDMVSVVKNTNNVKKHKNNSYNNITFKKLYNWEDGGLRNIDHSGKTYAQFISDLDADDVKTLLNKFGVNQATAIDKKYFLKIEPIFVLHFYYFGTNYYLQGTPSEIFSIITYDKVFNSTFRNGVIENFFYDKSFKWDVIKNYFFTTYINKEVKVKSDSSIKTNFGYWENGSNESITRGGIYSKWKENGSNISGLATGYLWIADTDLTSTITVTKFYGTPGDSSLDTTNGQACFNILYKSSEKNGGEYKIYGSNGKTIFCNHVPYNKNEAGITDNNEKVKYQQFSLKLPPGKYKIREINIADDVENVYFRQRTDKVGDYSIELKSYKVQNGYESQEIILKNGKKYYYSVFNELKNSNNGKIIVYKFLNKKDENGNDIPDFGIDDNVSYPYSTVFNLYKSDQNGNIGEKVKTLTKSVNRDNVKFTDLETGYYVLEESKLSSSISNVSFYRTGKIKLNDNLDVSKKIARSRPVYINNDSAFIYVYNELKTSTCDSSLQRIKDNYCSGGNNCPKSVQPTVISELYSLYDSFKDNNKILNFNVKDNGLDLSGVSCSNYMCDLNNLEDNKCSKGNLDFVKDDNINPRVCSFSNYYNYNSNVKGSFYADDIDAFCYYTYNYITKFKSQSVSRNRLLWSYPDLGRFSIKVSCENIFDSQIDTNTIILEKDYFNEIVLPDTLNITYNTSQDSDEELEVTADLSLFDAAGKPAEVSDILATKDCDSDYCYVTWNKTFDFNLKYNFGLFSDRNNDFTFSFLNPNYDLVDGKNFKAYGLPIGFYDTLGDKNAKFVINDIEMACPYNVTNSSGNDVDDCVGSDCFNKFDLKFRIIDTSNPFPGITGNNRLTGSNWCVSSTIGKIVYELDNNGNKIADENGNYKYSIVGDITGDFELNDQDYSRDVSYFNTIVGDINGSGFIEYENCAADSTADNCILYNYIKGLQDNTSNDINCSSNNSIVEKYITGKDVINSDSTDLPMYSFTLNSSDIKNIREYNKEHSYNDFNLECNSGSECKSKFLTEFIYNKKINGKSISTFVTQDNSRCFGTRHPNGGNKMCTN